VNDVEIIQPARDEECCCCRASDVLLHKWTETLSDKRTHQHCDLCYSTLAGNTCVYLKVYDHDTRFIVQHVNLVANIVLKELRGHTLTVQSGGPQ
jgi:hypothetical protein